MPSMGGSGPAGGDDPSGGATDGGRAGRGDSGGARGELESAYGHNTYSGHAAAHAATAAGAGVGGHQGYHGFNPGTSSYTEQALNEMRSAYTHNTYAGHQSISAYADRAYSGMSPDAFSPTENAQRYSNLQGTLFGKSLPATPASIATGLVTGVLDKALLGGSQIGLAKMAGNYGIGLDPSRSLASIADQGMRAHQAIESNWSGSKQSLNQAQRDFGIQTSDRALPGEAQGQRTPVNGITPEAQASIMANRGFQMGSVMPQQTGYGYNPYNTNFMSFYTQSPLTASASNYFPGGRVMPSNYYT